MSVVTDNEVDAMGRPKKGAKRKGATVPDGRVVIVHLKGSQAYADWLEKVHASTHIPKSTIMRLALEEWAKKHGHPKPPEL